ncbi:Hemerythrin HHE cation binding domain-containing protein [Pseudonocardia ammonioxydans]|uniref:Hemerythrin HHE cation binding domain-containing protein n=1 Tax=Pseudonocardia ammonioxydans TaxID=260086 RepID=A0A1I5I0M5_PSUAM|nr:hemerythrin domain-containing protein [Pseudonocardia ammonioxydans]SFO54124.1 Hemerythrin HHE cation binding domain-containing protein [Pseudonocardia ammonioxydans]
MAQAQAGAAGDVVDELTQDHHKALDTLAQVASDRTHLQERRNLIDTVIGEVVRHAVAEEMYVYPVMRERFDDGADIVSHDAEEHAQLERVMKELEKTDPGEEKFENLLEQMTHALRHHAEEEETHQFPRLRAHVDPDTLQKMREQVDQAKQIAPTRPHPNAPNSEVFHKVAGPGVGMIDRMRDRLSDRLSS